MPSRLYTASTGCVNRSFCTNGADILTVAQKYSRMPEEPRVSDSEFERSLSEFEQNLLALRKEKLKAIEALGQSAYPNRFPPAPKDGEPAQEVEFISKIREEWDKVSADELNGTPATETTPATEPLRPQV